MPEPSAGTAYHRIRRAIVEGDYRPGERLVEQRVAEDLNLSRTPVREALRMLEAEGLVRIEPNRGAAVRLLSVDGINDLYELRARLESYAAELAAERATIEQRDRLCVARDGFAEAAAQGRGRRARRGPHGLPAQRRVPPHDPRSGAHDHLTHSLFRTVDHPLVFQSFRQYTSASMARSCDFHALICQAIVDGEGDRAGRMMHEHVLHGRDVLIGAIERLVSVEALFDPKSA